MTGKLDQTKDKQLTDTIHWGDGVDPTKAVKLGDFIVNPMNVNHCLQVDDFVFLLFDDADDYRKRFGNDMKISVLGSRPILYFYRSNNTNRRGFYVGESGLGHERMQKHTRPSDGMDYIKGNPGVVILKFTGTRSTDEFNVRAVRELCEILINDFLDSSTGNYDTKLRPREFVGPDGCEQARRLIAALQKAVHEPLFRTIVGSSKTLSYYELKTLFTKRAV